jgi:mannose/fructose/N-acetylgalactosamine-specific phosphotransferase system component IID
MYIVPIAWLYVAVMMAVAEATSSTGTLMGALITFVLYGLGPIALVLYVMGTPARRRAIKAREASEQTAKVASGEPDAGSHTATDPVAPVREKP